MRKKKTTEEFQKEVYALVGDEYSVLGEYIGNCRTPIEMKHNICGNIYMVRPSNFLSGQRCPKCGKKIASEKLKKTTEDFKKEVYKLVQDEYEVLGEYVNSKTKILIRHNKCNHEYMVNPHSFLRGTRCPECVKKIVGEKILQKERKKRMEKRTTESFKKAVYDRVQDEYEVLGEYINARTPIEIKHNTCSYIYLVTPDSFLCGRRCPECRKKSRVEQSKKTTEDFKKEVYDLVKDEYEVSSEYINARTHINIKHNICGLVYPVRPYSFLRGRRCPECANKLLSDKFKKSTQDFKQEVYKLVGDEYEILSEYKKNDINIDIKHNKCGHIYSVRPHNFLSGKRCPKCMRPNYDRDTDKFKKEVYDLVQDEYEVLSEYINNNTYINMKHNKCGYIYPVVPAAFLNGNRCPECFGVKKRTTEEFKQEVYNLVQNEYTVLGEYINTNEYINMKHNKCGHIYPVKPHHFLRGSRCSKCFGNKKKTTEEFKKEVYDLVENEYEFLEEYNNNKTPIKVKHNKCGHIYPVKPISFLRGNRCPKCTSSKGESAIIKFLNKYNINYNHNLSYGGCSYKGSLRFDFLIFDKEGELKLIIEFDGIQHFEAIEMFGGEEGLNETKKRDSIKNDFCKENNINLIRIPYWEIDNIHKILGKKLYKLELI